MPWDDDVITPKLLLEHIQGIRNDLTGRLERLEKRMDVRFDRVEKRLDRVEGRLDRVEEQLEGVDRKIDLVSVQNLVCRERLDNIETVQVPMLKKAVGIGQ